MWQFVRDCVILYRSHTQPFTRFDKEEGQARVLRRSCAQVGRGLAFLHASGIVHGNLCSSSVLLRKSTLDRRGFIAKIGAPLPLHNTPTLALSRPNPALQTGVSRQGPQSHSRGKLGYADPPTCTDGRH